MADEPTWDDLFGAPADTPVPPPVQPAQPAPAVIPPPVVPPPVVPPPAVQTAPIQNSPTYAPAPPAQQPNFQAHPPTYVSQLPPAPTPSLPPAPTDPSRRASRDDARASAGAGGKGGGGGRPRRGGYSPQRPKRSLTWLWVLIVLLALGAAGAGIVYAAFGPQIRHVMGWEPTIDYSGNGNGQTTTITIVPGQIGADVANSLAKAGVTKTAAAFYDLLLKQAKAPSFEPGTYKLEKQISAKAALIQLSNPANRVISRVVIPEGYSLQSILNRIAAHTGVSMSGLQVEAKNFSQFGIPSGAPSLEGFLFPATYEFSPGTSAKVMLQAMVTRMNVSLKSHGVAPADELRVLTLASIIQKEGGTSPDFYKVSRVFVNRLAVNMPLQSDATVSYGAGTKTIATTSAQRADASNKYNTYAHSGLPIGPIASPGDTAIDAALHPVAGPWIYFVLVNGYTGETVFSTTTAGQDAGVKQWQAWLRAHPGYGS